MLSTFHTAAAAAAAMVHYIPKYSEATPQTRELGGTTTYWQQNKTGQTSLLIHIPCLDAHRTWMHKENYYNIHVKDNLKIPCFKVVFHPSIIKHCYNNMHKLKTLCVKYNIPSLSSLISTQSD